MSILSTNHRLISIGESYSAGNGIDITDQVISVTGDATPYSAGENIDIQDHIISGKDWSKDITEASSHAYNETTAWVKENYANSADMDYISAMVDTKLDASAWSTVSSDYATEDYVIMADNITYDRAKGYVDSKGYATEEFVNENTSGKLDSTAFTNWQNGQYSTDLQTIEGQISNKLDESAFGKVSGSFLTAAPSDMATTGDVAELAQTVSENYQTKGDYLVRSESANFYPSNNPSGFVTGVDLSNYYTKYETSGKEELANAFANIPAGDTEVNTYVQNNSATINEVNTTYQSNSSNYITAHQSLDGYATTSWVNEQGYLTEVSIPESATWNEVSTTVQTNSAQWGQGGGGSIPVSNSGNLYKVEFDGIDLYGYKSSTTIDSEPVYSSLSSQESPDIQNTDSPLWNNAAIYNFQWVGFDVISISSNGGEIYPSYYGNDGITALNVYYKADWLYNNNNEPLPPFSGYIGKITLDNLFISSYIDKPSYFNDIKRCDEFRLWFSGNYYKQDIQNKYICSIGTYVQSEPRTVEGIFVIPNSALPTYEYDSTNKISAINGSALAGGNKEIESYVQNNSATINEVNTTYQSNSSNYITAHQSLTEYVSKSDTNVAIGVENTSNNSFVQGEYCSASNYSFAQGDSNSADNYSFAQGISNLATAYCSFAQGTNNIATAYYSFAQGCNNIATAYFSFAQGSDNIAGYSNAFAQGSNNSAYGHSFAQGTNNKADSQSFAQGYYNSADSQSFAQGSNNSAYNASLAQGSNNTAYNVSIAQGIDNYASNKSQAFGNNTRATNNGMAIGTYNNTESAAFVVGNGKNNARSDSFIIFHDGSVSAAGKISANGVELGAGSESFPVSADEAVQYVQTNSATINEVNTTYQANSGNWQDITAYQNASAKYLTGVSHDNTLSGNGTVESPLGVMLSATNDANVNNIVITASLPSTPDANTIYFIPET